MGNHSQPEKPQTFFTLPRLVMLAVLVTVGYQVWARMWQGDNIQEALTGMLVDAKAALFQEGQPKIEEPEADRASIERMERLSAGLSEFRSIAKQSEADVYSAELFKEADALRKEAHQSIKDGDTNHASELIQRALALYNQAEAEAKVHSWFNRLYIKFSARADPGMIRLMKQYPTEQNRAVVAAYEHHSNLGTNINDKLDRLKAVISSYQQEANLAREAQAARDGKQARDQINQVVAAGDLENTLQTVQSALDQNRVTPAEALNSLWPILKNGSRLQLPMNNGPALSLVYIDAEQPYLIGQYEMTREQIGAVAPHSLAGNGRKDDPACCLSWQDATTFCNKLSSQWQLQAKLPSEQQWEFACRAGTTTAFSHGEELGNQAHYGKDSWTQPGSYAPNAWGLYDMHGNLMEWCHDLFNPADPKGPRAVRGGAWKFGPDLCRSDARYRFPPNLGTEYIGFRLVVTP